MGSKTKSNKDISKSKVIKQNTKELKDNKTTSGKQKFFYSKKKKRKETKQRQEEIYDEANNDHNRSQTSLQASSATSTETSKTKRNKKSFRKYFSKKKDIKSPPLTNIAEDDDASQEAVILMSIPETVKEPREECIEEHSNLNRSQTSLQTSFTTTTEASKQNRKSIRKYFSIKKDIKAPPRTSDVEEDNAGQEAVSLMAMPETKERPEEECKEANCNNKRSQASFQTSFTTTIEASKQNRKSIRKYFIMKKDKYSLDPQHESTFSTSKTETHESNDGTLLEINKLQDDAKDLNVFVRSKAVDPLINREKNLQQLSATCDNLQEEAEIYFKITTQIEQKTRCEEKCCGCCLCCWKWCSCCTNRRKGKSAERSEKNAVEFSNKEAAETGIKINNQSTKSTRSGTIL